MPFIRPYEQQVSAISEVPSSRASGGGAVAGALVKLGRDITALGDRIERRDQERDEADFISAAAELKAQLAERRRQAGLDGTAAEPEWVDKERTFAEEKLGQVAGNLRTGRGQRRAQQRTALFLAEETERWIATSSNTSAALQKNQLQNVEDLTLRAVQQDPTHYNVAVEHFLADLDSPAYSQLSKDLKEDYGREFKAKAARAMLDGTEQAYGSQAALTLLETVRDDIPAAQYTSLKDHFTKRAKVEQAQDNEAEQYKLFREVDAMIKNGGDPTEVIEAGVKSELMSAEQGMAWHAKHDAYVEHQRKVANATAAFRMGDLAGFAMAERPIQREVADAWVAEQLAGYASADGNGKQEIASRIVQKGVDMDYVFPGMQNTLRAPPQGEGFTVAVDLYRSLNAFDPYYASKYVTADQRARFDVYETAIRSGASLEQAMESARSVTPEAITKARKELFSPEGKIVVNEMRSAIADKPFWLTGDVLNGRQAANAVIETATLRLAGNPAADISVAVEQAQADYEARNVRMGELWVPRDFMSGVPSNRMAGVATRIVTRLPDVLRAHNLPVVDGEYALAPDYLSERDKRLQVYDPNGFPVPGLRFGPDDFKAEYHALQRDEYQRQLKERRERKSTAETQGPGGPVSGFVQ